MLSRISSRSTAMMSLANLQAGQARNAKLQEQLTSGKSMSKPSDNPVAANDAIRYRTELAMNTQYSRNISDSRGWVDAQEAALDQATTRLRNASDRLVQAGNASTMDQSGRRAIAAELRAIRDDLMGAANAKYQGRPVFAGTADVTSAVTESGGTYALHDDGGKVLRRVAPGQEVQLNVSVTTAFGGAGGTPTVFAQLDALATAVESGDTAAINDGLTTIDEARANVMTARTTVAARSNQLDALEEANVAAAGTLEADLEEVEGVDIAKAMVEYNLQSVAYQAALAATAKTIQPTLLDFLR